MQKGESWKQIVT